MNSNDKQGGGMTNDQMTNDELSAAKPRVYDLAERTAVFGELVIDFAAMVKLTPLTKPLISQLIRSATSIGANYCEADDADSKKDFRYKIGLCRKESRETKYWFRMIVRAAPDAKDAVRSLWKEAHELNLIFGRIRRSCDQKKAD